MISNTSNSAGTISLINRIQYYLSSYPSAQQLCPQCHYKLDQLTSNQEIPMPSFQFCMVCSSTNTKLNELDSSLLVQMEPLDDYLLDQIDLISSPSSTVTSPASTISSKRSSYFQDSSFMDME